VCVIVAGKQWREIDALAQARLVETGQVHIRALAQAESSRLSEGTSRSAERGSPKQECVEALAHRCNFLAQARNLTFGRGVGSPQQELV